MRAILLLPLLAGAMAAPESRSNGPTIPTCVPQHNTHDSLLLMCQSNSISNQTWAGCEEKNFLQVPVQRVRGRDAQAWSHGQNGSCLHSCERSNCVQSIYNMAKKSLWVAFDNCSRKSPQDYIRDTYCPTLGDHQHFCRETLSRYYVGMLVIYWSVCSFLFHVKSSQIIICAFRVA